MSYMTTFSLQTVNPLKVGYGEISLGDIAHSLSQVNRFGGHARFPISVAQHSVYVSRVAMNLLDIRSHTVAVQGLLHDASEAYLGDVTKWLKMTPEFAAYRNAERRLQSTIFRRFGMPVRLHPCVEEADRIMVRFEAEKAYGKQFRILHPKTGQSHPKYPPCTQEERNLIGVWSPWSWKTAKYQFLEEARSLGVM